jgi:hypothetical protein
VRNGLPRSTEICPAQLTNTPCDTVPLRDVGEVAASARGQFGAVAGGTHWHRYSRFRDVHTDICTCYRSAECAGLPEPPPKTWATSATSKSGAFLEERRRLLEQYLRAMLMTPRGARNPYLLTFLGVFNAESWRLLAQAGWGVELEAAAAALEPAPETEPHQNLDSLMGDLEAELEGADMLAVSGVFPLCTRPVLTDIYYVTPVLVKQLRMETPEAGRHQALPRRRWRRRRRRRRRLRGGGCSGCRCNFVGCTASRARRAAGWGRRGRAPLCANLDGEVGWCGIVGQN